MIKVLRFRLVKCGIYFAESFFFKYSFKERFTKQIEAIFIRKPI